MLRQVLLQLMTGQQVDRRQEAGGRPVLQYTAAGPGHLYARVTYSTTPWHPLPWLLLRSYRSITITALQHNALPKLTFRNTNQHFCNFFKSTRHCFTRQVTKVTVCA